MRLTERELREMCIAASSQLAKDTAELNGKNLKVRTGLRAGGPGDGPFIVES